VESLENDPKMSQLPTSTTQPGWPEFIEDTEGNLFVRLRDGVPTGAHTGHACQYGLVDPETDMIAREHLWTPTLGATLESCVMAGGTWMDPEDMESADIPPIVLPEEPIESP